jgi:hypothetical protein
MTDIARPPHSARTLNLEGAVRAAVAGGVPLAVLIGTGHTEYAAFALFAGFTAIFGAREAYRRRVVTVTTAGLLLAACMLGGLAISITGAPLWVEAIGLVVVLVVSVCTLTVLQTIPAQPIFPVFAFVVCALVPARVADLPLIVAIVLGAVAFAWLVAMSGSLPRRLWHAAAPHRFRPFVPDAARTLATLRQRALWETVGLNVVGALVAGAVAESIPVLGHPYWAVIAVISTLPAMRQRHTAVRALHRVLGTIGGTVIAVGVLLLHPTAWWIVVIAAVGQFGAEIFVARNYAVCLLFLTPLALAVSWLSVPEAPESLAVDRIAQTAIGAAVSVLMMLGGRVVEERRGRALGATSSVRTV